MTIKIHTSFNTLMQKAAALGKAKRSGDQNAIVKAQADHDAYKHLCLKSEKMHINTTRQFLDEGE